MENIAIESWLVIMGMSGLALIAVIGVAKLVRRLLAPKRSASPKRAASDPSVQPFGDEMRVRVFRQQADKAFQSISAVIDEEYRALLTLIENGQSPKQVLDQSRNGWRKAQAKTNTDHLPRQNNDAELKSPYAQIEHFMRQGLSLKEISSLLRIPRSEIELAVKLRSARHAA